MRKMRFWKAVMGLVAASWLFAPAAQALSVDLISNGDFETGDLSGWTTAGNARGETFAVNEGTRNPHGPLRATEPLSGSYDALYVPRFSGAASLTQFFTVPDQVFSATFSFTERVGLWGFFDVSNHQFRVSVIDQIGDVISQVYSTASAGLQLGSGTPSDLSFDLTALMQANQGRTLGVQFELEAQHWSMNASLDNVSMMVETPAAVPLPPTIWMMLAGLGALGAMGWKRRRSGGRLA